MDQDAFRQLLGSSTSNANDASGGPVRGSEQGGSERSRVFGKQAKRAHRAAASTSSSAAALLDLKPRKFRNREASSTSKDSARRAQVSSVTGEAYIDRAEARRLGKEVDDDFSNIERLRRDFELRIEQASSAEEKQAMREQMAFLGGDAKHSVLVKGLDFALLEQQRAKLSGRSDGYSGIGESADDLEQAYQQSTAERVVKKPREQGVCESGKSPVISDAHKSKFRPIGQAAATTSESSPEYIWKNGKRYRKKRKNEKETTATISSPAQPTIRASTEDESEPHTHDTSKISTAKAETALPCSLEASSSREENRPLEAEPEKPGAKPDARTQDSREKIDAAKDDDVEATSGASDLPMLQPNGPLVAAPASYSADKAGEAGDGDDDEDEDIFADAGRWSGEDDEDDVDGDNEPVDTRQRSSPNTSSTIQHKRDWFATAAQTSGLEEDEATSKSVIADVLSQVRQVAGAETATPSAETTDGKVTEDEVNASMSSAQPARLAGLSDSRVDIQAILQAEQERDERKLRTTTDGDQRKRQKRRKRGAGGHDSD